MTLRAPTRAPWGNIRHARRDGAEMRGSGGFGVEQQQLGLGVMKSRISRHEWEWVRRMSAVGDMVRKASS